MTKFLLSTVIAFSILSSGCTDPTEQGNACTKYFEPYPDHNPNRLVDRGNNLYVEGMVAYNAKDYEAAILKLKEFVRISNSDKSADLYLACSYLAIGQPYDAELALDRVENSALNQYSDEAEWYTVLSWLCSDQLDRALLGAEKIANRKQTYRKQAKELVKELKKR